MISANKDKIRTFLGKYIDNQTISDDSDVFTLGLVNSMFAMELVLYIEKEFNITIENEDLDMNNFRSINAIDNLINKKLTAKGSQS